MELINKNIGFAMTGSRRTTILIQFNGLPPSDGVGAKVGFVGSFTMHPPLKIT